jgi:hypothetical protein
MELSQNKFPYHRTEYHSEEESSINYMSQPCFYRFRPVLIGDIYNGYKIVWKLGYGKFSIAWLAEDLRYINPELLTV